jgi:hypothetical protein
MSALTTLCRTLLARPYIGKRTSAQNSIDKPWRKLLLPLFFICAVHAQANFEANAVTVGGAGNGFISPLVQDIHIPDMDQPFGPIIGSFPGGDVVLTDTGPMLIIPQVDPSIGEGLTRYLSGLYEPTRLAMRRAYSACTARFTPKLPIYVTSIPAISVPVGASGLAFSVVPTYTLSFDNYTNDLWGNPEKFGYTPLKKPGTYFQGQFTGDAYDLAWHYPVRSADHHAHWCSTQISPGAEKVDLIVKVDTRVLKVRATVMNEFKQYERVNECVLGPDVVRIRSQEFTTASATVALPILINTEQHACKLVRVCRDWKEHTVGPFHYTTCDRLEFQQMLISATKENARTLLSFTADDGLKIQLDPMKPWFTEPWVYSYMIRKKQRLLQDMLPEINSAKVVNGDVLLSTHYTLRSKSVIDLTIKAELIKATLEALQ